MNRRRRAIFEDSTRLICSNGAPRPVRVAAPTAMDFLRRSLDYALSGSFKRKVPHNMVSVFCVAQTWSGCFCCWGIICGRILDGNLYGAHRVLQNCYQKGGKFTSLNLSRPFSCVTKHMTPCTSQEAERRDEAFVSTLFCSPISHLHVPCISFPNPSAFRYLFASFKHIVS